MDLSYYANLAEILGTVAIVISLIYVAVQIRQNTRAMRLTTAQNISHDLRESIGIIASETEMAGIHLSAMTDISTLTPAERHRFYIWLNNNYRMYENAYYQNKQGALDDWVWDGIIENLRIAKTTSGYRSFWHDRRHIFSKEFQNFFEKKLPDPVESADEAYYRGETETNSENTSG